MRRPLEAVRARETQVGAERIAHRVDEALGAARREAVLPPEVEHLHPAAGAVDARLDPADEAVAEEHRQHVPAPAPLGGWDEELPDVVELEQGSEQGPVPHDRIERRQECDRGRRLRGSLQQSDLVLEDEPLPAHAFDLDGNELAVVDELLAQRVLPGASGHLGSGLAGPMPPKMSAPPTPRRPWAR